jgi:hypothetical protein
MEGRSTSSTLPHADAADRRLLAYALATGAVAVPAADGAIVYSGVLNQTVSWSATGNSVEFNVDGAGSNDLRIGWNSQGNQIFLAGINGSSVLNTNTAETRYFRFGDSITDGQPTVGGSDKALANYASSTPFALYSGSWYSGGNGYAVHGGSGYAGFQLGGGSGQLGWLHVTVPAAAGTGSTFTVHGYAYESVAEQSITAGAGAVPAPGALLTLALGAAGIRGRRARAA